GALSVAGVRGMLAVGADQDLSYLGAHILASTVKHLDQAVILTIRWFLEKTLPRGRPVILGLDDDAVGIGGISPSVPGSLRQRLGRVATQLRQRAGGAGVRQQMGMREPVSGEKPRVFGVRRSLESRAP